MALPPKVERYAPRPAATKTPAPSICSLRPGSECERRYIPQRLAELHLVPRQKLVVGAGTAKTATWSTPTPIWTHVGAATPAAERVLPVRTPHRRGEDRYRLRIDGAVLPSLSSSVEAAPPRPAGPRVRVSGRPRVGATGAVYWGLGPALPCRPSGRGEHSARAGGSMLLDALLRHDGHDRPIGDRVRRLTDRLRATVAGAEDPSN